MSESLIVALVAAAASVLLSVIGTLMIRSNNRNTASNQKLEVELDAVAKESSKRLEQVAQELSRLVTQVAVQDNNHSHITERLILAEGAVHSLHRRVDDHQERLTRIEAWKDAGNPEVRKS